MKDSHKCYIIGGGDCNNLSIRPNKDDLIIAADSGYLYLEKVGIKPDYIIGDFDSMDEPDFDNKIKLKVEKDETDMEIATRLAIDKGYNQILIYGGLGGDRLDHTIANIQMMAGYIKKGIYIILMGDKQNIYALHNGKMEFVKDDYEKGTFISLFSMGGSSYGVDILGLKYELKNENISSDFPIGVSNEFMGEDAYISVEKGTLLIVVSKNSSIGR